MAWNTTASAALDADFNAWTGYTVRQVINTAGISVTGGVQVRVTFKASSAEALTINPAYIQQAADAGDAYDFSATPVQLLFSGNPNVAIAVNSTVVSDAVAFTIPVGKNLVISYYVSGDATHDGTRSKATLANWTGYYKAGNDAATVNTTGYSSGLSAYGISLVEVYTGGQVIIWSSE